MFSPREQKIINSVGKKPVTVKYLVDTIFDEKSIPFYAEISVTNSIRTIIKKCEYYQLDWSLVAKKSTNNALYITKE